MPQKLLVAEFEWVVSLVFTFSFNFENLLELGWVAIERCREVLGHHLVLRVVWVKGFDLALKRGVVGVGGIWFEGDSGLLCAACLSSAFLCTCFDGNFDVQEVADEIKLFSEAHFGINHEVGHTLETKVVRNYGVKLVREVLELSTSCCLIKFAFSPLIKHFFNLSQHLVASQNSLV